MNDIKDVPAPDTPSGADMALLHSGHEADAARAMENIEGYSDQSVAQEERARDANGRFAKNQAELDTDAANEPEADQAPAEADDAEAPPQEAAGDDEQDYLELPVDDGDPERLALEDVVAGYRRAKELEQELENVRTTTPAPPDYDQALMEAVESGQQYLQRIEQMQQMMLPRPPDERLVDPNSENYDPDAYHNQLRAFRMAETRMNQLEQERQRVIHETTEKAEAANSLKFEREQAKLHEFWPEIKNNTVAKTVRDDLQSYYGVDSDLVDTIHDSRFFAIAKDALAYRAQQKQGEKTARAVKAKPKLVKGSRNSRTQGTAPARDGKAMERLAQEGTDAAAADAMKALKIL